MNDEDKRKRFGEMGRNHVARTLGTNGFNSEWTRLAAQWLAEQDDIAEEDARALARKNLRFAKSAALAGWLAFAATIIFGIIQLVRPGV